MHALALAAERALSGAGAALCSGAMSRTIIVAGYGPGISTAVAERFGKEGYQVALVARSAERLQAGVKALEAKGVKARAFEADLSDPGKAAAVVEQVRRTFGPVAVLHWNPYSGAAPDVLAADAAAVRQALEIGTTCLLAAIKEALIDLRAQKGAVLVTNGGLGINTPKLNAMSVQYGSMGLALGNAAKHKLVGLLAERLKPEGVYVGEVVVLTLVKGTAFDRGQATLEPATIAERFWSLFSARADHTTQVG